MNDNTALWWVIKGPVVASIMVGKKKTVLYMCNVLELKGGWLKHELIYVLYGNGAMFHTITNACISFQINFVLFIGIIIILVQKLQSPDIGGNESSIYLWVC